VLVQGTQGSEGGAVPGRQPPRQQIHLQQRHHEGAAGCMAVEQQGAHVRISNALTDGDGATDLLGRQALAAGKQEG
jgi:hypothetical protein